MAISVISSASAAPALAGVTATDSSSAGFADLLFSQLGAAIAAAGSLVSSDAKSEKASEEKEQPTEADSLTADPALAFLMSNPALQPAPPTNADASLADTGTGTATPPLSGQASESPLPLTADGKQDSTASSASNTENTAQSRSFAAALGQQASAERASASNTQNLAQTAGAQAATPGLQDKASNNASTFQLASASASGTATEVANSTANIAGESSAPQENSLLVNGYAGQASKAEAARSQNEVATPLHSTAWTNDFSDKVVWLAKNDQQQAQININPPQLGPIQITLNISGDQATAVFTSAHAEVRQAIENSLPQLKEMLSGAGINLGQADVGANLPQQHRESPSTPTNGTRLASETAILPGDANAGDNKISTPLQRGRGLVDLFA